MARMGGVLMGGALSRQIDTSRMVGELAQVQKRVKELQVTEHFYTQTLPSMVGQSFEPLAGIEVQFHSTEVFLDSNQEIPGKEDFLADHDLLATFDFHEYLVGTHRRMVLTYRLLGNYIPYAVDASVFDKAFRSRLEAELNRAGYTLNKDEPDGLRRVMNFNTNASSWLFTAMHARHQMRSRVVSGISGVGPAGVELEERDHGVFLYPTGKIVRLPEETLLSGTINHAAEFNNQGVSLQTVSTFVEGRFVQVDRTRSVRNPDYDDKHGHLYSKYKQETYYTVHRLPEGVSLTGLSKYHKQFLVFEVKPATEKTIHQGIHLIRDETGTRHEMEPAVRGEDLANWWIVRGTSLSDHYTYPPNRGGGDIGRTVGSALTLLHEIRRTGAEHLTDWAPPSAEPEKEVETVPDAVYTLSAALVFKTAVSYTWSVLWPLFLIFAPVGMLYGFYASMQAGGYPFFQWVWPHVAALTSFLFGVRELRLRLRAARQLFGERKSKEMLDWKLEQKRLREEKQTAAENVMDVVMEDINRL